MEFDKSKILTVVTADQAKVGQKGWFGEYLDTLKERVEKEQPNVLERVDLSGKARYIFRANSDGFSLFYPAPEPTYAERQAEWIKENNVKVGTKVRFTKDFNKAEDGSYCASHSWAKGKEGVVSAIHDEFIYVEMKPFDIWACPFTALEVIKEPTYRPFKNAEEFKPYRDEWFVSKCDNSKSSSVKALHYSNLGVVLLREVTKNEDVVFDLCRWDEFFKWFIRENGDPCGVMEKS